MPPATATAVRDPDAPAAQPARSTPAHRRRRLRPLRAAALLLSAALPFLLPPAAAAAAPAPCAAAPTAPAWHLRRVLLDRLWQNTRGAGVRVAVIDTGVDGAHPQLRDAVDTAAGRDFLGPGTPAGTQTPAGSRVPADSQAPPRNGTHDPLGHGTMVAGLIAARPRPGSGFVGLAPAATIIPIRQNDDRGSGTAATLAAAIDHAVARRADVITISQNTSRPVARSSALIAAVHRARAAGVVLVASAGNDTHPADPAPPAAPHPPDVPLPAALAGVLAVAASDRAGEAAPFSTRGPFVGVSAPGVDIVSTVPGGGLCAAGGTSFAAPQAAAVAALLVALHPDWSPAQVVTRIQQTAERSGTGHDPATGWGVVDPVRALTADGTPGETPTPDPAPVPAAAPEPAPLVLGETARRREVRYGTYALGVTGALLAALAGITAAVREARRQRAPRTR
ncbi:type VII secretion-associated serine protease mycosin [Streptomyces bambusae]|uniref:type VII secretion-associated serine protease mycosin n=1 Tax=Streptomyces bambusae TaxID=1550616 RepID=UPI001CFFE5CF|nr:type VII secretion-associated serine protease mycosin [Streptomyces bambusae]MCB5169962.1 type VII secretion-associated serine protease mycosin [Streptomyces bambusae]